jgi:hypothetical protein
MTPASARNRVKDGGRESSGDKGMADYDNDVTGAQRTA